MCIRDRLTAGAMKSQTTDWLTLKFTIIRFHKVSSIRQCIKLTPLSLILSIFNVNWWFWLHTATALYYVFHTFYKSHSRWNKLCRYLQIPHICKVCNSINKRDVQRNEINALNVTCKRLIYTCEWMFLKGAMYWCHCKLCGYCIIVRFSKQI